MCCRGAHRHAARVPSPNTLGTGLVLHRGLCGHRKALDQRLKSFLGPFVLCGLRWVVNMPQPLSLMCYVSNWKFLFQMFNQMAQDYYNLWKHLCPLLILQAKTHNSCKQPTCIHCSSDAGPDSQGSILLPPNTHNGYS